MAQRKKLRLYVHLKHPSIEKTTAKLAKKIPEAQAVKLAQEIVGAVKQGESGGRKYSSAEQGFDSYHIEWYATLKDR